MNNNCCNPCQDCCSCKKPKCGCAKRVLDIDEMPDTVSILRFNYDGLSTWYDFGNMIYQTQTDTTVSVDAINRVLKHMAERHIDTISARELGSILHVADLGDVDITNVAHNSLFVYQKDNNCAAGCEGINNRWIAWNKDQGSNSGTDMRNVMGFKADGAPMALLPPANTGKHYVLAWRGANEAGWKYIEKVSKDSITSNNKVKVVCVDPNTNELVCIEVDKNAI